MRWLVGIDDTDTLDSDHGTGKASRWLADRFERELDCTAWGSVRQQLLVDDRIDYTTHNSAACVVLDGDPLPARDAVVDLAAAFLRETAADGSDPGLCVARAAAVTDGVRAFGERATTVVCDEREAYERAREADVFLDEYGGTGEGVVGALAAVGLTATGDRGRFVGYGKIREYTGEESVACLRRDGIETVTANGDPVTDGVVDTKDWVRPELRDWTARLPLVERDGRWVPQNAQNR